MFDCGCSGEGSDYIHQNKMMFYAQAIQAGGLAIECTTSTNLQVSCSAYSQVHLQDGDS